MVSTTTFVSVAPANVGALLFAASPAKCSNLPPVVNPDTPTAVFNLNGSDLSLNGLSPATLPELFALGNARHYPTAPDAPSAADHIFAGRDDFTNDVTYFKALLETRMRMRMAIETNLKSLQDLRAGNNALIRKRKSERKSRRAAKATKAKAAAAAAAASPAPLKASTLATKSESVTTLQQSIATTAITTPATAIPSSVVTVDAGVVVPDTWQVCSSPVSTEDSVDDHRKDDHGHGIGYGCGGAAAPQHNVQQKQAAYYRV